MLVPELIRQDGYAFAYEQVQVLKGPSSENFGMGTTGGAINIQQKTAHLGEAGPRASQ